MIFAVVNSVNQYNEVCQSGIGNTSNFGSSSSEIAGENCYRKYYYTYYHLSFIILLILTPLARNQQNHIVQSGNGNTSNFGSSLQMNDFSAQLTTLTKVVDLLVSNRESLGTGNHGNSASSLPPARKDPTKQHHKTTTCQTNEGELVYKEERLVVPEKRIKEILELNHDHMLAGHLGVAKTMKY